MRILGTCIGLLLLLGACGGEEQEPAPSIPGSTADLPGFKRWSDRFTSSGRPDSPEAWAALTGLGVKTLLCVEGAPPDVAAAKVAGLRCYHVPVGHESIERDAVLKLVAVARLDPGSLHVNCDDGGTRAITAIALLRMSEEGILLDEALGDIQKAGVDRAKPGLLRTVVQFKPATEAELASIGEVPAQVPLEGLRAAMVAVAGRVRVLDKWAQNNWERPIVRPTLGAGKPPAFAGLSAQALAKEIAARFRDEAHSPVEGDDAAYFERFRGDAEAASMLIDHALRQSTPAKATTALTRLRGACTQCHSRFR